jgi:hypothetical protein
MSGDRAGGLSRPTAVVTTLVAANLVPLAGVFFLDWDAGMIVLFYWAENLAVGVYAILKIAVARTTGILPFLSKLCMIPFFCVHYGMFCAIHGVIIMAMFKVGDVAGVFPTLTWSFPFVLIQLPIAVFRHMLITVPVGMGLAVLGLFISHGVAFAHDYIGRGEYTRTGPRDQMGKPYRRIVILHIAIIAGAAPVMTLGSPWPLLGVLVLLKTGLDVILYVKARAAGDAELAAAG